MSDREGAGALDVFLRPRAVAIIGASNDAGRVGGMPLSFLRAAGFRGTVYPVNPSRDVVQGETAYASIADVPGPVDLAIIAVPADRVVSAVEQCASYGVRGAIVFSSGFAEADSEGQTRQDGLADVAARTGIRICGPNCAGIMSTPERLTASFGSHLAADVSLPVGPISVVSQSGAVGAYLFTLARQQGIGLTHWITTGNEVDVTVADFVEEVAQDDQTRVIALYLEQVRNVDVLIAACRTARSQGKRLVAVLAGRTDASAEALKSHTASLAGDRAVAVAALEELGITLVDSIDDLLSASIALSQEKQPTTDGLGIITISGAAGIMTVDRASEQGLTVPTLTAETQARMRARLPYAGTANPVDVTGNISNQPEVFRPFLDELLNDARIGGVICFLGHVLMSPHVGDRLRADVVAAAQQTSKPIWLVGIVTDEAAAAELRAAGVGLVTDPVEAVDLHAFNVEALRRPASNVFGRRAGLGDVCVPELAAGVELSEVEAAKVFSDIGVRFPVQTVVTSRDQAQQAAAAIAGGTVVMKVVSSDILHKSDIGGVRVGVEPENAAQAYDEIIANAAEHAPRAVVDGVVVAEMAQGHPVIVGTKNDPTFGPVVLVGSGGIYTELLRDRAIAFAPVDREGADRLIESTSLPRFLAGARGSGPLARESLIDVIVRVSELAWQTREQVASLELNPVLVNEQNTTAVDAMIETKGMNNGV